jgi:heme/copper-type cytochrome/quinol oxidase subunit 3
MCCSHHFTHTCLLLLLLLVFSRRIAKATGAQVADTPTDVMLAPLYFHPVAVAAAAAAAAASACGAHSA